VSIQERNHQHDRHSELPVNTDLCPALDQLLQLGTSRAWLSYEELNNTLPDEMVDPDRLHELLVTIDERSIEMVDELEYKSRLYRARRRSTDSEEIANGKKSIRAMSVPGGDRETVQLTRPSAPSPTQKDGDDLDDVALRQELAEALAEAPGRRVDDPIRTYLSQMGTIPLLTRDEEVRLAKKIETTRMIFRRRCLESDYVIAQAYEMLRQVESGVLPFDRTMRISTAEPNAKERTLRRIPYNLRTLEKLIALNRTDWETAERAIADRDDESLEEARERLKIRRRKMAALTEELSLRTGRIIPLMKKLRSIAKKMRNCRRTCGWRRSIPGSMILRMCRCFEMN
jgi:RNA polymerase primary sigma factor